MGSGSERLRWRYGPGLAIQERSAEMGAQHDTITVTEMKPNQCPRYQVATKDNEKFRWGFPLSPTGGDTKVTRTMETVKTGMMTKTMVTTLALMGPRLIRGDLERMKARLGSGMFPAYHCSAPRWRDGATRAIR